MELEKLSNTFIDYYLDSSKDFEGLSLFRRVFNKVVMKEKFISLFLSQFVSQLSSGSACSSLLASSAQLLVEVTNEWGAKADPSLTKMQEGQHYRDIEDIDAAEEFDFTGQDYTSNILQSEGLVAGMIDYSKGQKNNKYWETDPSKQEKGGESCATTQITGNNDTEQTELPKKKKKKKKKKAKKALPPKPIELVTFPERPPRPPSPPSPSFLRLKELMEIPVRQPRKKVDLTKKCLQRMEKTFRKLTNHIMSAK